MSPGNLNKFKQLNAGNYFSWKIAAKAKLITERQWKYFKTASTESTDKTEEEREIAFSNLILLIDDSQYGVIMDCNDDPKEAWDAIVNHYEKVALSSKLAIKRSRQITSGQGVMLLTVTLKA